MRLWAVTGFVRLQRGDGCPVSATRGRPCLPASAACIRLTTQRQTSGLACSPVWETALIDSRAEIS